MTTPIIKLGDGRAHVGFHLCLAKNDFTRDCFTSPGYAGALLFGRLVNARLMLAGLQNCDFTSAGRFDDMVGILTADEVEAAMNVVTEALREMHITGREVEWFTADPGKPLWRPLTPNPTRTFSDASLAARLDEGRAAAWRLSHPDQPDQPDQPKKDES